MKPKFRNLLTMFLSVGLLGSLMITNVHAQFLPPFLTDILYSENLLGIAQNRTQVAFIVAVGGLLILAVGYLFKAAADLIREDDESGKIEDSTKSVRRIMVAIATIFVGILGIGIIVIFFGGNLFQLTPHAICIDSPDSVGCYTCKNSTLSTPGSDDLSSNRVTCEICNLDTDADISERLITVRQGYDLQLFDQTNTNLAGSCKVAVTEVRENSGDSADLLNVPRQADL